MNFCVSIPLRLITNTKLQDHVCKYGSYFPQIRGSRGQICPYPDCKMGEGIVEEHVSESSGREKKRWQRCQEECSFLRGHGCPLVCTCMCVHARVCARVCGCMCARKCVYMCVQVCACACVCVRVYVCVHVCGREGISRLKLIFRK